MGKFGIDPEILFYLIKQEYKLAYTKKRSKLKMSGTNIIQNKKGKNE